MSRWHRRIGGTSALALVVLVGAARNAHAAFDGSELEQMLGWLCVVPIGAFQLFAAVSAKKHVQGPLIGLTLLALVISLGAGLAVTLCLLGDRTFVPALTVVMLGPGIPVFVAMVRARVLQLAFALFVLPPLPFVIWLWETAR